jgi:hypothetical protein
MNTEFVTDILNRGLTSEAYQEVMEFQADIDPASLEGLEAEHAEFTRLNLHRVGRIRRTWRPSERLAALILRIDRPQVWLALTEPWCGDSAQCMPCLDILAEGHAYIAIRYLLRDENLEIMDRYLTEGKRGIPLVVSFDPEGRELFRWGPRPAAAQVVMNSAIEAGLKKPERLEKLHLFYGRNQGAALDDEWVALLDSFLGDQT